MMTAMLSIVVPTYNERDNIEPLVQQVFQAVREASINAEMIVVDDDSPDGTAQAVAAMEKDYPVRCIIRRGEKGLATAVLRGIAEAKGKVIVVMDADLSHPPDAIPALYKAVIEDGADVAVGSRYVPGGGSENWPAKRIFASRAAGLCARGLTSARDATSGFFAFRKQILKDVELKPIGYKICLEIILRGSVRKVTEVPITFRDRSRGKSKLGYRPIFAYFRHLIRLYVWAILSPQARGKNIPARNLSRFVLPHILAFTAFILVTAFLFRKVFTSVMIYGNDITFEFFFKRAYGFGQLLKGDVPLWNPHNFCGYPFVAGIQTAIFYPLNLVFLIFNTASAFTVSTVIHVLLSGLGMYAYAWRLTKRAVPSIVAGMIFMLNGFLLSHIYAGHVTILCAYPWLPLIILALHISLEQNSWRWACAGGIFLGLQILAGYPLITLYTALLVIAYTLGWVWTTYRGTQSIKDAFRSLCPAFILGVSGAMLSAIQLLPTYIFSMHSVRSQAMTYDFATSFSFPPENLVTYFAPMFFGDMTTVPYWGRWLLWEVMPYVGILPLCMLVFAAFSSEKRARAMAWLGLAAVLLAFGRYAGYYRIITPIIPVLSLFRGPARSLILFTFAAAAGSALAIHAFLTNPEHYACALSRTWKILAGLAAVILLVLIVGFEPEGGTSLFWRIIVEKSLALGERISVPAGVGSPGFLDASYALARKSLWIGFTWLAISAGIFALLRHRPRTARWLVPTALVVLIPLDLLLISGRFVKGAGSFKETLEPHVVQLLQQNSKTIPPRIATARDTEDLSRGLISGISHVGGWEAAQLRRYCEYTNVLSGRAPEEEVVISSPIRPGKMLNLMGISHVLTSPDRPAYPGAKRILREKSGNVYEMQKPFPRAFLVHQVEIIPEKQQRLEQLRKLDSLKVAIVEHRLPTQLAPIPSGAEEAVSITKYSPHRVEIAVQAASPALLVLTDAYYPVWRAALNGRPAQIFPTNHLFRGVTVPAGSHRVVFTYNTAAYTAGKTITLATLFGIIICLMSGLFIRKKQ